MTELPVLIITGMHRSGTSLLTRCLEQLGLFAGVKKEDNNEAEFFLDLNRWILFHAKSSWDNLSYFRFIDTFYKENMLRVVRMHLTGLQRIKYLGMRKALQYRNIADLDIHWGWKDPRNTFTIDIWKEIFPHAKLLHIYRNPMDVTASLKKRQDERIFRLRRKDRSKERKLKGRVGYIDSLKIQHIEEGIKLWEEYIDKAFSLDDEFNGRIYHIQYEDFLENHDEVLTNTLQFLDMDYQDADVARIGKGIRADRKFAFVNNKSLVNMYNSIREKDVMVKLGYHNII